MYEVMRWISLAMMWVAIAANWWCIVVNLRLSKKRREALRNLEEMYGEYEKMRNKYIELLDEQWRSVDGDMERNLS